MSDGEYVQSALSGRGYRLGRAFRIGAYRTHEASDDDDKRCWVKLVPASDERAIARLRYEAITLNKLDHPGIVRLLDRGRTRSQFFLVLEALNGRPLADMLKQGPLPVHTALTIATELAEQLVYLHGRGIVCRTFSPSSVYINHMGRVVQTDFSAAWDEVTPPRSSSSIENHCYASPEDAGGLASERRSDIYVLGVLLFELLAGEPPFAGASRGELALAHLLTPAPNLATACPGVPQALAAIVERCLAKQPAQRYPSAAALLEDLRAANAAEPRPLVANQKRGAVNGRWTVGRTDSRR